MAMPPPWSGPGIVAVVSAGGAVADLAWFILRCIFSDEDAGAGAQAVDVAVG